MLAYKKWGISLLVCFIMVVTAGCSSSPDGDLIDLHEIDNEVVPRTVEIAIDPAPIEPEEQPYTTEAKLLAVGDIMMHGYNIIAGRDKATNTYNFDHFFSEVTDILSQGDWVIGNLETTTAGEEHKFTGYPMFNAPVEILDALKNAGFTIVTHANNHTLDRKEIGVIRTRDAIEERGLYTHGTARSWEESEQVLIVEKNEIKLALVAYTYGTNGIPIPQGKEYLVNLIDEAKIIADIQKAREQGADVVAVSLHFGQEYQLKPNQEQITLAHNLVRAGADIILGSHPHVVQPYEVVELEDEQGIVRKGHIIYSMGNFISSQIGEDRNLGLIFGLTIRKHFPEGTVEIGDITNIPTWVQRYKSAGIDQFRIIPLAKSLEEKNDVLLSEKEYKNMERYLAKITAHVASMANVQEASDTK